MRKYKVLLLLTFLIAYVNVNAQAPQGINYQAVLRDNFGNVLVNQSVGMLINIHSNSPTGPVVYSEAHTTNSNNSGIVNLVVGQGTPSAGAFANIPWGNGSSYYAEILADQTGGTNYQPIGVQQLMSVPYALYAERSGNTYNAGTGINVNGDTIEAQNTQAIWNAEKLQGNAVSTSAPTAGQVLKWDGNDWKPDTDNTSGSVITYNAGDGIRIDSQYYIHSNFTENGGNIHNNNAGNVGIGTNTPAAKLHLEGDLRMSQSSNNYVQFQVPASSNQTTTYELPPNQGNAGEFLGSNGAGQLSWSNPLAGGSSCRSNRAVFQTVGSNSWTVPTGVTKVKFRIWSGGGDGSFSGDGGGGGGGYAEGFLTVVAGEIITMKVPTGGGLQFGARDTAILTHNGNTVMVYNGERGNSNPALGGYLLSSTIPNVLHFAGQDGQYPEVIEISSTVFLKKYGHGGSSPGLDNGGQGGIDNGWSGSFSGYDEDAGDGGFPGGGGGGGESGTFSGDGASGLIIIEY